MRKTFVAVLMLLFASVLSAQQAMNNDSVIKLIKAGLGEDIIITTINSSPGEFDTSVNGLIELKSAGVSEKTLAAIMNKELGVSAPAAALAPAAAVSEALTGLPPGVDTVGIYYKDEDGVWKEVNVEVVNFATGGFLRTLATAGVVGRNVNGRIAGNQSRLAVRTPTEFLFNLPEGQSPGEYQLLRLRVNRNNREFRSVTGGVFNSSSGAQRDMVDYTPVKVSPGVYTISIDRSYNTGEYGFLAPQTSMSQGNIASSGRMYTFTLIP